MNCKDCKHFHFNSDVYASKPNIAGSCKCQKFKSGYHNIFVDSESDAIDTNFERVDKNGVSIEGDEGWGFSVGVDFGCVHFSAKQN